ncbi:retrovirus-related Pol polyprotein from transposon 297 [Elysia marginata]|uniref:Retrovirus-related Pol polyprotein from transposon 297 n=1 Tax=Elysia marginata TaxID=1093978 RepID=A0AAV4EB43_9GAST|nr:retrovirus-related Pol polyprotein from transposon 297 [Elysia marginata]
MKDLTLQVDSSQHGVGIALMQDGRPIEFASKTLSPTQRRWAQIEKELLAVVIGLERFDQYTYGLHVVVQNDHKPLENIMKKPLSQTPRRLQNLLMRLHRYDCEFQYLQGPNLLIADTLSRAASILSIIPRTSDSEDNPAEATTGQRRSERLRARPQWMKDY